MNYSIQNIVFPTETKHQQCIELFYRGMGYLDRINRTLTLSCGQTADFATYLNGCSYRKWLTYANVGKASLTLDIKGDFTLVALGYSKNLATVERAEFFITNYAIPERKNITIEYPENNEQILGFEIHAKERTILYGGYYSVECKESDLHDVRLCIATTTCRKEKFITKNVELLKKEILNGEDVELRNNIYVHVVDNGRTLTEEDIYGDHVYLHPNPNAGGSGGFARGMIESLNQNPQATHVLLMDDDVLVLPESIKRTYKLLKLIKDEYKESFISGAMLYYEIPNKQHEDIGYVGNDGFFHPKKGTLDLCLIEDTLNNESNYLKLSNEYAAWWYCCIPSSKIKENGLPLPLFIRGDDVEYALRCKANIITMNGICVWHMGFATKYNAAMNKYQECRNILVDKACSNILNNVDLMLFVKRSFRMELFNFDYSGAELVLKAFEDYLKGPTFLEIDQGEKIVKDNSKLNDHLTSLNDLNIHDIDDLWECYSNPPRKFLDKWLFRITYNGHRLCPHFLYRNDSPLIPFDFSYQPQKVTLQRQLIVVNPYAQTGCIRTVNKKRYKELQKRWKTAMNYYKKNHKQIEEQYRQESKYLTSEEFWKKYLGLDQ